MTVNKNVQNPDSRNALRVKVMEEGGGKIIYTAPLENQKNLDLLQHIYFHKTSAVLRMNIQSFFVQRAVILIIQGRQCDICTKLITCPACGIHHLAILKQGQQGENGRIMFYNNFVQQLRKKLQKNKITNPPQARPPKQKHAILDAQFKDFWMLIFSRVCHLKLFKYGCHQQQLQEAGILQSR